MGPYPSDAPCPALEQHTHFGALPRSSNFSIASLSFYLASSSNYSFKFFSNKIFTSVGCCPPLRCIAFEHLMRNLYSMSNLFLENFRSHPSVVIYHLRTTIIMCPYGLTVFTVFILYSKFKNRIINIFSYYKKV